MFVRVFFIGRTVQEGSSALPGPGGAARLLLPGLRGPARCSSVRWCQGLPCSDRMLPGLTLLSRLEFFLKSCPGSGSAAWAEAVAPREEGRALLGREAVPPSSVKWKIFTALTFFTFSWERGVDSWLPPEAGAFQQTELPGPAANRRSSGSLDEDLHVFRALEVGISLSLRLCPRWLLEVG